SPPLATTSAVEVDAEYEAELAYAIEQRIDLVFIFLSHTVIWSIARLLVVFIFDLNFRHRRLDDDRSALLLPRFPHLGRHRRI
ncbi:hypothetical protein PENTCL1PPCAC_15853, partial [Pristionchus entomophagus]